MRNRNTFTSTSLQRSISRLTSRISESLQSTISQLTIQLTEDSKARYLSRQLPTVLTLLIGFELVLPFITGLSEFVRQSQYALLIILGGAVSLLLFSVALIMVLYPNSPKASGNLFKATPWLLFSGLIAMIVSITLVTIDVYSSSQMDTNDQGIVINIGDSESGFVPYDSNLRVIWPVPESFFEDNDPLTRGIASIRTGLDSIATVLMNTSVRRDPPTDEFSLGWLIIFAVVFGIGYSLVKLKPFSKKTDEKINKNNRMWFSKFLGATFMSLSLFGALLKVESFNLFSVNTFPTTIQKEKTEDLSTYGVPQFAHFEIGYFRSGRSTLDPDRLQPMFAKLSCIAIEKIVNITLVGRTDREDLSDSLSEFHGTNSGLATARAEFVKHTLTDQFKELDVSKIVTCISGPSTTESSNGAEELRADRKVDVYIYWLTNK